MSPTIPGKSRIAERLAQARRNRQPPLSQSALAEKARACGLKECSGSRISRLEAGYADAEWAEVEALAKILKVTSHWLASLSDTPAATPPPVAPAPIPTAAPAPTQAAAPEEPAIEVAPVYVNGEHPDLLGLSRSAHRSEYDHRLHATAMLARARAKLHEAGLPPLDWRHWRVVEKRAVEELRSLS